MVFSANYLENKFTTMAKKKRQDEPKEEGLGKMILKDFLGYYYFEGLGCLGVILWIICLPFILIYKALCFIFNLIF